MFRAIDDVPLLPTDVDRWAVERQYLRCDAGQAIGAFPNRRAENLDVLDTFTPEQWKRGGIHATTGKRTLDDLLTLMAWHGENHLDQLKPALAGQP